MEKRLGCIQSTKTAEEGRKGKDGGHVGFIQQTSLKNLLIVQFVYIQVLPFNRLSIHSSYCPFDVPGPVHLGHAPGHVIVQVCDEQGEGEGLILIAAL